MQKILYSKNNYKDLDTFFKKNNFKNVLVVCGHSFYNNKLYLRMKELESNYKFKVFFFDRFEPNPTYESVCEGIKEFKKNKCDCIIAVGGGSAMDVAKCIKLFSNMNDNENCLTQTIIPNNIPFIAIPTTAGTGSEATHFAVIYYKGEKKSVSDMSSIPDYVLFDSNSLKTLTLYQKKATLMDAFSHSIESIWSINSTDENIEYATKAITLIKDNLEEYLKNNEKTFDDVLEAANLAGKAINITKTTAGHAMCYKLTSLYKISHGHAALLINSELYPYMIKNLDKCIDKRGKDYLLNCFNKIANLMDYNSVEESTDFLKELLKKLDLYNIEVNENDLEELVDSVNVERLMNNPIRLEKEDIENIYKNLFKTIKEENNK